MENIAETNVDSTENAALRVIKVTLQKNAVGHEVLHFEGAPDDLDIDFTKSDQSGLRKLFCWLLDEQLKQKATLELVKDSSVKNVTYQKVAEDYINDLNAEISSIFANEAEIVRGLTDEFDVKGD